MKDGRPVPPAELARKDRERQQKVMDYARKLAHVTMPYPDIAT